jgi:hypothetical protein
MHLRRRSIVIKGFQCTERRHLVLTGLENDVGQPDKLSWACLSHLRIEMVMDQESARHLTLRRKPWHEVLQKIRKLIEPGNEIESSY